MMLQIAPRDRLSIDGKLPITLQEATPIFVLSDTGVYDPWQCG